MTILFLDWPCFNREGTVSAFEELGHRVCFFAHPDYRERSSSSFQKDFDAWLAKHPVDLCFSYNFFPVLAEACHRNALSYVSFLYDSPYVLLYSYTLMYPTNYVFLFDRAQYETLRTGGLTNVFYHVLPAAPRLFSPSKTSPTFQKRVTSDISFVGQLYNEEHNFLDRVTAKGDEYLNGYLQGIMEAQMKIYGDNFIEKTLTPAILARLQKAVPYAPDKTGVESLAYTYATYFIDRKITSTERMHFLSLLGARFPGQVKLFTWDKTAAIDGVLNMGIADYQTEMPSVFHNSKINLNISLRSIITGIPLRCLDIMANGGFLLSNYQEDLASSFIAGEDFIYYEDAEDMLEKTAYYLSHEKERLSIAKNGQRHVQSAFNFVDCFSEILKIVTKK